MDLAPLLAGAALGALSAEPVRRAGGRRAVIGAGISLVTAAVIYPAARRDHAPSAALAVEAGVVLATTTLAAVAAGRSPATGRRLLALGWAAHALFDFGQGPSPDSRLPSWYAPVCAGFDVAYAARLAL
ncbi:MAG TPA: hypothetical protein VHZ06_02940 [Marmoricola sp.]|jgi:hypothetical protein|nr:hypothetical protein [Marmoricola sp.]